VGDKPLTVKGIVIPVDWDEKGKVVATALSTHNEDEYLIDPNYKGKELLHFVQKEVEVSGIARKSKDKKTITVKKYILKNHGIRKALERRT